jgi:hypothetical protein
LSILQPCIPLPCWQNVDHCRTIFHALFARARTVLKQPSCSTKSVIFKNIHVSYLPARFTSLDPRCIDGVSICEWIVLIFILQIILLFLGWWLCWSGRLWRSLFWFFTSSSQLKTGELLRSLTLFTLFCRHYISLANVLTHPKLRSYFCKGELAPPFHRPSHCLRQWIYRVAQKSTRPSQADHWHLAALQATVLPRRVGSITKLKSCLTSFSFDLHNAGSFDEEACKHRTDEPHFDSPISVLFRG